MLDLMSKNEYLMMRTAIICTNAEEAEDLNTFLILTKKTLLIHDKMKSCDIRGTMTNFNRIKKCFILYLMFYCIVDLINVSFFLPFCNVILILVFFAALQESWIACVYGSYPVLICTDPVLSDLNFTNIQWLIHFSVLSKLKNQFNYRFSLLLDNLTEVIIK